MLFRIQRRDYHPISLPECRERVAIRFDMMRDISRENVKILPEDIFSYDVQQMSRRTRGTPWTPREHSRPHTGHLEYYKK